VHLGGSWAIPGGALQEKELPLVGGLRELREETGFVLDEFEIVRQLEDDHGGWSYWTFLLHLRSPLDAAAVLNWETDEIRWVSIDELEALDLFPAFRVALSRLGVFAP
jgi:8-oxo-dGTP pyrophosphatase MutT (NUDIX family)